MIDEPRQRLSALLDGQLAATQLPAVLDALTDDPQLRACWERYTLIGQAMRGEAIESSARALAEQVRTALRAEPILLRPPHATAPPRRWTGRQTGWALAASVLLVAVVTLPLLKDADRDAETPKFAGAPLAVPLVEHQRWHLEQPELASKLDRYLVTHQAKASATGATELLPYAMLVGYETGR